MKPIGPLMWEHRLIERLVSVLSGELKQIDTSRKVDVDLLTTAVDFFRTYADRTHHGKEEDILFRELEKKPLSAEHARVMKELIQEHVYARKTVGALVDAKDKYKAGDAGSIKDIVNYLKELINFYPVHIEKEDKQFFYPILEYFTKQEQDDMLAEFWEFDRKLIHEKYQKIVEGLEIKGV
jgi:hemerythrin-like domain-containing protein